MAEEEGLNNGGEEHSQEEGPQPIGAVFDEDLIDEDLAEDGEGEAGDDEEEAKDDGEGEGASGAFEAIEEGEEDAGCSTAFLEFGGGFYGENDTDVVFFKFFEADGAGSGGGVVEVDGGWGEAFDHEEVAEVPEGDNGEAELAQLGGIFFEGFGAESVAAGGFEDAGGLAAVAGYAAFLAEFGEGDVAAIVAEDDAEGGGSAFDFFELEEGGGADALFGRFRGLGVFFGPGEDVEPMGWERKVRCHRGYNDFLGAD